MIGVMPMPPAMKRKSCRARWQLEIVDGRRDCESIVHLSAIDELD